MDTPSQSLFILSNAEESPELSYVQTQAKSCIKGTEEILFEKLMWETRAEISHLKKLSQMMSAD